MATPSVDTDAVPGDGRDETETERLDRNWVELLQELRVTQTGTQILTGFLLTIPFQQRFTTLDEGQLTIYLVLVGLAGVATVLALAPVALHRVLFRRHAKRQIVPIANVILISALVAVALTLSGTVLLVFDLVLGPVGGIVAALTGLTITVLVWLALPVFAGSRRRMTHRP